MFPKDLEGHAPSWPWLNASGRDRSASLQYRHLVAAIAALEELV